MEECAYSCRFFDCDTKKAAPFLTFYIRVLAVIWNLVGSVPSMTIYVTSLILIFDFFRMEIMGTSEMLVKFF